MAVSVAFLRSPSKAARLLGSSTRRFASRTIDLLDIQLGAYVLDVGCGVGDEVRAMARRVGETGGAVGVDHSAVMIAKAQTRSEGLGLPVAFHVGDAASLDFPDNVFDGARADRVLIHLNDPQRALMEMVRVLKPGARIVVFDPEWETLVVDLPDRALVRKIVTIGCDHLVRNAWIGRELYHRFHQLELIDVAVEFIGATLSEPTLARTVFNLDGAVQYGQENGLLSPAELAAWSEHMESAKASGRLFAALGGFLVSGRKPGRERTD